MKLCYRLRYEGNVYEVSGKDYCEAFMNLCAEIGKKLQPSEVKLASVLRFDK